MRRGYVHGGHLIILISGMMAASDGIAHRRINNNLTLVPWSVKGLGRVIKRGRVLTSNQ